MALDPNIILQARGVQLDSPLDTYARVAQVQAARNQNRIADIAFQDRSRAQAADSSLAQLLASGKSGDEIVSGLAGGGFGSQALAYQKTAQEQKKAAAELKKAEADAQETQVKAAKTSFDSIASTLGALQSVPGGATPVMIQRALGHLSDIGVIKPEMVDKVLASAPKDPRDLPRWLEQQRAAAMSAKEQDASRQQQQQFAETKRSNMASEANSAGQLAVSRGNLGLAQQRLTFDRQQPRGQVVQTDTGPILVDPRTGNSQPVMRDGKPVTSAKAPTEFQGKSAAFGARADEADKIISSLSGKYSPAAINSKTSVENTPLIGGILGSAANRFALSESDQKAEQAQRDFVNAVLRQESGAAIGASEFDNARKQYFPQPGDGKGVIEQKNKNRKLAIQGLKTNAGRAAFDATPSADANIFDQADAILGGK